MFPFLDLDLKTNSATEKRKKMVCIDRLTYVTAIRVDIGMRSKMNGKKNGKAMNEHAEANKKQSKEKPQTTQHIREKLNFTEQQIIDAVKAAGHPASSREVSDKLGIKDADQGRAYIRSRMAALMKNKKISGIEPEDKSRCTFLYSVVE